MTTSLGELPWFIETPDPEVYFNSAYLVIDMETTNLDKGSAVNKNNRLLHTSIKRYGKEWIRIEGDEFVLSNYLQLFYDAKFIVAHNAKFELQWLYRVGLDLTKVIVYDTMLGDYVLSGNRAWALDLDSVADRYGANNKNPYIKRLMASGVCPSTMPYRRLAAYCDGDVENTETIFLKQREVLKENGLLPVMYNRCMVTPLLAEIGMVGMHLDKERVYEVHKEFVGKHQEILRELNEITGGINMASPQQVAEFLYETMAFEEIRDRNGVPIRNKPSKRFPEGTPKTDEDTLLLLKARTKEQRRFIELKSQESKLRKKITGYTENFVKACEESDCFIHGKINQSVTRTQRLSSSNPNQQNIDRTLKRVFNSRHKGWKIRGNDYEQLEYRIAGILAQDKEVENAIRNREDVHSLTASIIFAREWAAAGASRKTREGDAIRTESKSRTFKPLYGGTSGTKAEQEYYRVFKEKYRSITAMQDGWVFECLDTGKYRIPSGLIYYFPDAQLQPSGYITNNESIKNYPVQCIATADVAPIGTVCLWHRMKSLNLKSFIINLVHDSVENEEAPEEYEIMGNLSVQAMSKDIIGYFKQLYGLSLNYPLDIESKVHTHWGSD
jgi:DNA polymerase I-like protein with 3'-5' exonuclease and polymerase domains